MNFRKKTISSKIFARLQKGKSLTAEQISQKCGSANPAAHIDYIRSRGVNVVSTPMRKHASKVQYSLAVDQAVTM